MVKSYKPGQWCPCRIEKAAKNGYFVTLTVDDLPGFLRTNKTYQSGQSILARFVKVDKNSMYMEEISLSSATEADDIDEDDDDKDSNVINLFGDK